MTDYIVGSDHSGGKDQECINKVVDVLNANGHNAEAIGVNSNLESTIRAKGKGKTAIFIVNGVCIGTFDSHMNVVKSGLCDYVWFGMPQSINPSNEYLSEEGCQSLKVPIAHDDNFTPEPRRSELNGKYTIAEYCTEYGQYVGYACGSDCEAMVQKILSGGSGGTGDGSESSSGDDKKNEPTPMSYMDMIKDLIKIWDGDVEVKIRQDRMYINKVPEPRPELWIVDGNNVTSGSAKVTDYNSDTVNTLNVTYNDGANTITVTDEYLINRFGVVEAEIKGEKVVTDYSGDNGNLNVGTETGEQEKESLYTQISKILQDNYEKPSEGWNCLTNKVRLAKDGDEIGKLLSAQKKKKGKETTSYIDVRHEIQKLRGMGY